MTLQLHGVAEMKWHKQDQPGGPYRLEVMADGVPHSFSFFPVKPVKPLEEQPAPEAGRGAAA